MVQLKRQCGKQLRVTENRCILFNSLTYIYVYTYIYIHILIIVYPCGIVLDVFAERGISEG